VQDYTPAEQSISSARLGGIFRMAWLNLGAGPSCYRSIL